ncbi:hypothetical protein BGX26_011055 [Mortierella sp. AD094]|nr:hypothetical protein BGX26_011055 [Mortierella sp. AD094]
MDILSRLPVEIAFQILSKLNIEDIVACQCVCRQWYWITVDQSIWKGIFLEHEKAFATPMDFGTLTPLSITSVGPEAIAGPPEAQSLSVTNWKQRCRTQIVSDRNWSNGHIQSLYTMEVHRGGIVRLRIKGSKLLSGDSFGEVAIWDTTTYSCEGLIDAASGSIQLLDFSEASMIMTIISKSGVCKIWDLKTKTLIRSSSAIGVTCMTMNDEYLILGTRSCRLQIVDFRTGQILKTSEPLPGETLYDIYIQNNTLIVATGHFIRILSINTLEVLMSSPLPITNSTHTYCSVIHIRSLILLTDNYLLHMEWEPLYKSPKNDFIIDTHRELPPNLAKAPFVIKTKTPPISTITSIAIGGKHPHVLIANADRPSLDGAIRVCPPTSRYSTQRSHRKQPRQQEQDESMELVEEPGMASFSGMLAENVGVVLTSQVEEISVYLETCGLKPSFMDVDDNVIVIGTSKGDIVVLSMIPQE